MKRGMFYNSILIAGGEIIKNKNQTPDYDK